MSTVLSLQGVRGGSGVTTVVAALGHALHAQRERVLLIESSPDNLLGLHLDLAVDQRVGWARAWLDGADWQDAAFEALPGLAVLPYGEVTAAEALAVEAALQQAPDTWATRLPLLAAAFDWILFDLPQHLPAHVAAVNVQAGCTLPLLLATVDPGSHVLLHRRAHDQRRLLVNRYAPTTPLQRDLMQLWQEDFALRLVPQPLHDDANVPAALASKAALGAHAADSLAAADVDGLALWCLAEAARRRGVAEAPQ